MLETYVSRARADEFAEAAARARDGCTGRRLAEMSPALLAQGSVVVFEPERLRVRVLPIGD